MEWTDETYPEWPRERVYANPATDRIKRKFMQAMPPYTSLDFEDRMRLGIEKHQFTQEYADALLNETSWRIDRTTAFPEENSENFPLIFKIASGETPCPACKDKRKVRVPRYGSTTGVPSSLYIRCRCTCFKDFHRMVTDPQLVPPRFSGSRLRNLVADERKSLLSKQSQTAIIELLKANPENSYFFYGTAGTGKSHFLTALLTESVAEWASFCYWKNKPSLTCHYRFNTNEFLEACVAWVTNRDGEDAIAPPLGPVRIRELHKMGYRVHLYLEEIDKFKATEFKLAQLAEIVNAVYEAEGVLVATANTRVEDLHAKWNSSYGHAILRRFMEGGSGMAVYFEGSQSYQKFAPNAIGTMDSTTVQLSSGKADTPGFTPNRASKKRQHEPREDPQGLAKRSPTQG